ncbi:MAG TPA: hypothetical protein VJN43_02670 [Bryobacteraceae bacterium]|nr:hypothetical protein [Bryobacteraceae bacterium]
MRFLSLLLGFAILTCAATAPLAIFKPSISDMEDGPAVPPTFTFVAGQFLFLSFEIGGYKVSDEHKIHLSTNVQAFDPKGIPLMEPAASTIDATLAEEDKNWKPKVRAQILLPPLAGSGNYKILVSVKDDLSGSAATEPLKFEVRGRDVPPSDTLIVRNFHFYRGENDRDPLPAAAYKAGDTLWARFDITGYKFGPGNSIDVDYGIAVLASDGRVLFKQEKSEEEKSASFYPKAYVPCTMNLSLQSTIRAGQYTIVVTPRDHIGNQTYEAKANFTIE